MKIGQFSDTFYPVVDGVGRVVVNYANTLARRGHECYVVAPMADTGYRGAYPFELVDYLGVSVPGSPQYKAGLAAIDPHYHARIEDIKIDIAHAHTPFFSGTEAIRMAVKNNCPLVGTFHSKYYDDFYKATGNEHIASLGVRIVVEFYDCCDEVWTVSRASADVLRGYGYRGEIQVMENGTELREMKLENRDAAIARFGLEGDAPVLLYVGQLNWKKNILNILLAAAELKKHDSPFKLVLAGQGPDREAIQSKLDELGLSQNAVFTGHICDNALLDGLYMRANLFVFPSTYDTSSLVLREAAAMRTPSVVTRGSAPAEVVRDGENGLIADDDPMALFSVIDASLKRPGILERLGDGAHDTIPVGWDTVMDGVVGRYEALVETHKRSGTRKQRPSIVVNQFERLQDRIDRLVLSKHKAVDE